MSGLFKRLLAPDRQETRLAYEASFYPTKCLGDQHKLVWEKNILMSKEELEEFSTEDMQYLSLLSLDGKGNQASSLFFIHWIYGNIPTELEWILYPAKQLFKVEMRISPLIKAGGGKVALIYPSSINSKKYILPEDPTNA
jgi:hypothetical protein